MGKDRTIGVIRRIGDECVVVYIEPKEGDWILKEDETSKDIYKVVKFRECDFLSCHDNAPYHD